MTVLPDDRPVKSGAGSIELLPSLVADRGWSRVFLLTGRGSFRASGAARVLPELQDVAEVQTWSEFATNPDVDDLIRGVALAAETKPDVVIGIGGGSVLDMAKLVSTFVGTPVGRIVESVSSNEVTPRQVGLVLAPTTSGSGSEATHFAVAYVDGEKFSVADPSLVPDLVVLDPALTISADPYQKATSVIDAIAQAVESLWARGATRASREHARTGLGALIDAAPAFVAGEHDAAGPAARGSHLAGRAIDLSKTTGAHAMAYGLTQGYGISHGHAVAVTLGAFARRHASPDAIEPSSSLLADLETIAEQIGAPDVAGVGDRLDRLAADLGLELRLSELGVDRSDLRRLARTVNRQRLANNPVALEESALVQLLDECW